MYRLDEKDMAVLNELRRNSRASFRKIARKLNVATTTVINKYRRLLKEGIVKRATIEIDYEKMGYTLIALIDLRVSKGRLMEVEEKVAKMHNVFAVYDITGASDAIIIARFPTRRKMDNFLKKLQTFEFVERTETKLVLNTIKEENMGIE